MAKYLVETFGCQMNQHDSERMSGLLESSGYDRAESDGDADLIVINTCSVREKAEEKLYTRLGEIRIMGEESGTRPVVAVAGCVAQQEGESLLQRTNGHVIDVLIGTQSLKRLPLLVDEARGAMRASARMSATGRIRSWPRVYGTTQKAQNSLQPSMIVTYALTGSSCRVSPSGNDGSS